MKQQILLSLCNILPGKNLRKKMREKVREMSVKNAKICASYSVWDGEELLEGSIKQIRSEVDYINVVWQKISWYGAICHPDLEKKLLELKQKGLIDELIFFEPDLKKPAPINEVNKRNVGLKYAKKAGCTHFVTMDTDEYYIPSEFAAAKKFVLENDFTHTACCLYVYSSITRRSRDCGAAFVPFLYKIGVFSNLSKNVFKKNFCFVDPTRQMSLGWRPRFCFLHNVSMHHFTVSRRDLYKKLVNSSSAITEQQAIAVIDGISGSSPDIIDVDNIFDINI